MPSLLEQQIKRAERARKAAEDAKEAARKARVEEMKAKNAERAARKKKLEMLGETILDSDLTPQEHAVIARILARRKTKPADWELLADWMPETPRQKIETVEMELVKAGK